MLLQLLINSVVSGLLLALVAVGFNLIFNSTKVFHLAHGAIYVCGPYILIFFLKNFRYEKSIGIWFISFILSILLVILLSWLIERLVYYHLFRKKSGQAITLISSLGIYIFSVNLIAILFGNETKFIHNDFGNGFSYSSLIVVPIQLIQFGISSLLIGALLFLTKTRKYLQVRAVMSNELVASVMGVNTKAIRLFAMASGGVLAAVAAILRLYDTGIDPNAGLGITLSAAVAVIIGGGNSISGTIVASLLIAFLQTTTEWFLSAQWKEGMTFLLLIIVILWRTEGIVSFKMRIEEK